MALRFSFSELLESFFKITEVVFAKEYILNLDKSVAFPEMARFSLYYS